MTNRSRLDAEQILDAVVGGLLSWQAASGGAFTFDVWIGMDRDLFVPERIRDGWTTLHFASATVITAPLTAGQVGTTDVWFDPETAEIVEADITLNDLHFLFTTDEALATYDDEGVFGKTVVLRDVVTHELGHALGLSHSGVFGSTMFSSAWADQATLACDDQAAIRQLYAPGPGGALSGALSVADVGGTAGLQVTAVSAATREPAAGTITEADGRWAIHGLDPGEYVLLGQGWGADPEALTAELRPEATVCGGDVPARTPLAQGAALTRVSVSEGVETEVDAWSLACGGGIDAPDPVTGADAATPRPLPVDERGRIGWVERITPGPEGTWYALQGVEGPLSLDLLSYSLFSRARVDAVLTDAAGVPVPATVVHPRTDLAGIAVWDTRIEADLPAGDYLLYLEASGLPAHLYPGGEDWLDPESFVVFLGQVGDDSAPADGCPLQVSDPSTRSYPGGMPLRRPDPSPEAGGCRVGPVPSTEIRSAFLALIARRPPPRHETCSPGA